MAHIDINEPCIVRISQWDNAGPAFFKAWVVENFNGGYVVRMDNGEQTDVSIYDIALYDEMKLEDLQRQARYVRQCYKEFDDVRNIVQGEFRKLSGF
jgi:hypothetical protein